MNARDPFNIRVTSPALHFLRSNAATVQQRAVQASRRLVASVQDTSKKFDDDLDHREEAPSATHGTAMSYALPQSEPTHRHHPGGANGHTNGGITEKVSNMLGNDSKSSLPMYKDKPYQYPLSSRKTMWYRRRRLLALVLISLAGIGWFFGLFSSPSRAREPKKTKEDGTGWFGGRQKVDWEERAELVKNAFRMSWNGYEEHAWGYDEYHPQSKTYKQMSPNGMGWIIVDALDTMMMMNLSTELTRARQWLHNHTYDQAQEVNTFETTIRMLGGLLSAHYLSTQFDGVYAPVDDGLSEDLYIEKATDLADRLLGAYDSASGVPFASINLHTRLGVVSHVDGGASSLSEATSTQLEMKYLAKVTGEDHYWKKAEHVMKVVDDNGVRDGLAPIYIYADRGTFRDQNIRLGSRGDSYYEYLIKQYLQTSQEEPVYQEIWNETLAGIKKHLITYSSPSNFTVLAERPNGLDNPLSAKLDHLVCFYPGTLALATTNGLPLAQARKQPEWGPQQEADMSLAEELMKTCWGMYKVNPTGLAPEIVNFNIHNPPLMYNDFSEKDRPQSPADFKPANSPDRKGAYVGQDDYIVRSGDRHNLQRPETVESLFYMWRITGDEKYRNWGWEMFKSFVRWTAVDENGGFTSLSDVTSIPPGKRDNMESFWLAETLKYFYLLFRSNDILPITDVIFNTEAHPFPKFHLGKLFKTGWDRKPRDKDGKIISGGSKVDAGSADGLRDANVKTEVITQLVPKEVQTETVAAVTALTDASVESTAPADSSATAESSAPTEASATTTLEATSTGL